jgi:hypothetical protein
MDLMRRPANQPQGEMMKLGSNVTCRLLVKNRGFRGTFSLGYLDIIVMQTQLTPLAAADGRLSEARCVLQQKGNGCQHHYR